MILVHRLVEEIERDKQVIQNRKLHDKEYLKRVLIENEENKRKQQEILKKEREEDIKICEEYAKVLDKQEKDRENYFKTKEKKADDFSKKIAETVIKSLEERQKTEEENIKRYQFDKELKYNKDNLEIRKKMKERKKH